MKLFIKRMLLVGIWVLFFAAGVCAESRYVSDQLKLTLRSGPSTEHKILAVIESGQVMEILQSGDEWSLARLPDGKEGYVLTRYLTSSPTHNIRLEQLEAKHKSLMQQAAALLEENNQLKEENKSLKSSLGSREKELNSLSNDYQKLKTGSAEFLTLKTKYNTVASQLTQQTQRAEKLDEELSRIELNQYIKWFLAGSGVLLVGFIVGFSARRQRRRPSLL